MQVPMAAEIVQNQRQDSVQKDLLRFQHRGARVDILGSTWGREPLCLLDRILLCFCSARDNYSAKLLLQVVQEGGHSKTVVRQA